jgi:hypothetical protein
MRGRISIALLLLIAIGVGSALRVRATAHYFATQRHEDLYYLPTAKWLPVLSLGFREAGADLVWMRALIYYGDGFAHHQPLRHVVEYASAIVALDPEFEAVYRWASTAAAYQTTAAPVEDLERTGRLLERGVRRFPSSGPMAWSAGSFYSFELAPRYPVGSEGRRRARERGSVYLMQAARRGAGPPWLALSNSTQLERLGDRERAIQHLEEMYALTSDREIREQIAERIASYRNQADDEARQRTFAQAQQEWRANYPYLPSVLAEMVGPRSILDGERPTSPHGSP